MKKRFSVDNVILLLCASCAVLAAALAAINPTYLVGSGIVLLVIAGVIWCNIYAVRRTLAALLHGAGYAGSDTQQSLAKLALPVVVLSGDKILWYNDAFLHDVAQGEDCMLHSIRQIAPGFDKKKACEEKGQNLTQKNRQYTVFGSGTAEKNAGLYLAYFVNDTFLKDAAEEYAQTRPAVMLILIDTYDEILKELKESERARISSEIDFTLEQFVGTTTGFLRRISVSKYIAVIEERHMAQIVKSRFSVLDTVRKIGNENTAVTLSIGVGRGGHTLRECEDMATQALDMALGRGGDQAALKGSEGFEFYGGVSRSVEKRSKVRSRIIATALKELIAQSGDVMIMGHKMSDLDALGSAVGLLRICKIMHKPVAIVVREDKSFAPNLIQLFRENGYDDAFLSPTEAEGLLSDKTLLIITDTQMPQMLESTGLYHDAQNVVVIDHHRKGVGHIDDAVIFYHEPAASSASELVSELLQYIDTDKENKLTPMEAQALLAGIMLDTRNFALHTGVRTFEAAAYLRRMGAQTAQVKKLFNSSLESYAYRAQLVTDAEMYLGCAVVASADLPPEMSVVVPQAANDLLTIEGVQASFVAVDNGTQISVSGRSMGEVNVQVILEKLGGGGHLTMAGAQMRDISLEEAKHRLLDAISEYREGQLEKRTKSGQS